MEDVECNDSVDPPVDLGPKDELSLDWNQP